MTDPLSESIAWIDRSIAGLHPLTREVFLLHRIDGLTYEKIAARHHLSVVEVQTYIAEALDALRRAYARAQRPWWQRWLRR